MPPLVRVWWQGALVLFLFLSAGTWFIFNAPARTPVNVARLIVESLPPSPLPSPPSPSPPSPSPPSPSPPSPSLPATPPVVAPVSPSLQPTASSSSSHAPEKPYPSAFVHPTHDRIAKTRDDIMARYARFKAARDVATQDLPNSSWPIGSPVRVSTQFISEYNLHQMWGAAKTSYTMLCSEFSPMCEDMTPFSLLERFYHFYQPAQFYPSKEAAINLYRYKSTNRRIPAIVQTLKSDDFNDVAILRRGWNVDPPAVAVLFNGWVTKGGSVLSDDVFAPLWPDPENITTFRDLYFPTAPNTTSKEGEWRHVKEVVVLSHIHQGMFWHVMVSEFFRIFPMLPYIQANEDVYIHSGWAYPNVLMDTLFALINIPKERILFNTKVHADIVYLTQFVDRNDIPSIGLTQLISDNLHNYLGVPSDQRLSALAIDEQEKIGLPVEDMTVNILLIVRKIDTWRGRSVINHEVLKQAIVDLALAYPAKLQRLSAQAGKDSDGPARSGKLNITITEHLPGMKPHVVMKLFSRADLILGPHGAGFANLFAARPGTHVVELITSRHLNLFSTARLGLTYHACVVANTTREGIHEKANAAVVHFVADVPFLTGLVESILDSRFLRA